MRTPYLYKTDCGCIVREDSLVFCQLHGAAPDLLEACKEAFNNFMGSPGFWHTRGELPSIGKILESAISKAERGEWK